MRWFLDTEFHEDGRTIDLISIALVSEDGAEYYAVSNEFDEERCSDWVKANVLPRLHVPRASWKSRREIAEQIRFLVLPHSEDYTKYPEFWAYFADYDWVALCQLYGTMMELPKGFPFFCMDFKQLMVHTKTAKEELPPEAAPELEHNALADARWLRSAYLWHREHKW